jgi:aspartate kinase
MARYVLKFGGTSVANMTRLHHAAQIIKKEVDDGNQIVVVVSAMAGVTNELCGYAQSVRPDIFTCERDVILASGEQITAGLMALILERLGVQALSFLGWQVPIITDSCASMARILDIPTPNLEACLAQGIVPVLAGFQGVDHKNRITTLGRGGSDTTAVAVAAALKAHRCDIYTDVDGIYTADPRFVEKAKKIKYICYSDMFELAAQGAKVLQERSVELAMKHSVPLQVLSSFSKAEGTFVGHEEETMEKTHISGIAHNQNEVKVAFLTVPDEIGVAAQIFGTLASHRIHADMITKGYTTNGVADVTFTIPESDLDRAFPVFDTLKQTLGFSKFQINRQSVKLSIVGVGMRNNLDVASSVFRVLAEQGIQILLIATSEIKISVMIEREHLSKALNALHAEFFKDEVTQ